MLAFALKSAIVLALLYWVFFALLSKETFHRINRITLVSSLALSVVLPLLPISMELPFQEQKSTADVTVEISDVMMLPVAAPEEPHDNAFMSLAKSLNYLEAITIIYYVGIALMLLFFVLQTISLVRYMRVGLRHTDANGNTVILKPGKAPSFSFLHYIIMSVDDYEHNRESILLHEQSHILFGHTYDLMLLEAVKVVQWFNPFVWLLSRDLRSIHEYEADMHVLDNGIDATQYQRLLVSKAAGPAAYAMINGFNHSQLITRIIMMNKTQSSPIKRARYFALLPMLAIALVVTACVNNSTADSSEENASNITLLINKEGSIMFDNGNSPELVSLEDLSKKLTGLNKDATITVIADRETNMSAITDVKEVLRNWGILKIQYSALKEESLQNNIEENLQNNIEENHPVFTVVEEQPEFPGGDKELLAFIKNSLTYPAACEEEGIQGRVTLSYIVEPDGSISNIEEVRSPHPELTKEAVRVIESMPKWKPGKQRGQEVRVKYVIPITFRLK